MRIRSLVVGSVLLFAAGCNYNYEQEQRQQKVEQLTIHSVKHFRYARDWNTGFCFVVYEESAGYRGWYGMSRVPCKELQRRLSITWNKTFPVERKTK